MPRTPHDNSAEMKATEDRRKILVAQRKTRLGELLQSAGADGPLDFEQIAGLVRDGLERLERDPGLAEVWRRKGQEHFRRGRAGLCRPCWPGPPARRGRRGRHGRQHSSRPAACPGPPCCAASCWPTPRSIRRLDQAMARADKAQGLAQLRSDTADRRARTRLLIELGGLVVKAGLHERVDDDRATLLGGLLLLDDLLRGVDAQGPSPADLRIRWRRQGAARLRRQRRTSSCGERGQAGGGHPPGKLSTRTASDEDSGASPAKRRPGSAYRRCGRQLPDQGSRVALPRHLREHHAGVGMEFLDAGRVHALAPNAERSRTGRVHAIQQRREHAPSWRRVHGAIVRPGLHGAPAKRGRGAFPCRRSRHDLGACNRHPRFRNSLMPAPYLDPHPNRESWLNDVAGRLRPAFAQLGAPLPDRLRIAIGFPSTGRRAKATGECWDSTASADATFEILVRPDLAEADGALALSVATALTRELVHAAAGIQAGRGPAYRIVARGIGLLVPMRATSPGPAFLALLAPILDAAGLLPHASRHVKCACPTCGYVVRTARKWIDSAGPPYCPQHGPMLAEPINLAATEPDHRAAL